MKESPLHKNEKLSSNKKLNSLILLNDDVNTFLHVIKSLVEVCGHNPIQAEQCAIIVHFKGSCQVKLGNTETISSMSRSLSKRGLRSRVEL